MTNGIINSPVTNLLGAYLKDRREKLDPTAFGLSTVRRRTRGLRREEVAQRASISVTWYTWLEQGRGGAPSPDVLDRISRALALTDIEREHLYLLGLGRPPEARYNSSDRVSARLQRVLDSMPASPALVKTATWDVVAWNRAATTLFTDYGALPQEERNIMRMMFCDARIRAAQTNWESTADFMVSVMRADIARIGAAKAAQPFIDELCRLSPDFEVRWRNNRVGGYGDGVKHFMDPHLGSITLEYSAFAVDGRPDLTMLVYNAVTPADGGLIQSLLDDTAAVSGRPAPT